MGDLKLDLLQGTLDLMVLQTLAAMGEQHGYGIARRIEQVSGDEMLLNQGTIYASLVRLQQRGWISAEWGVSENNRKAKYYSITKRGRKQLAEDAAYWQRLAAVMGRVLGQGNRQSGSSHRAPGTAKGSGQRIAFRRSKARTASRDEIAIRKAVARGL